MFFTGESFYSFIITVAMMLLSSVMAIMYLPNNTGNRRRYRFIKTVRMVSLYIMVPGYALLAFWQLYTLFNRDFVNFQHSLWQLVYLSAAGASLYILWYKIVATSNEAIHHFRRGSFDTGKFQKTYDNCRRATGKLIIIALIALALQFFILDI